jgi:hypothetical protein
MSTAFSFFLRLFLCFVAARFLLQAIGMEGRGYLVGLTILFLLNVYWFSYLVFRERPASRAEAGRQPAGPPAAGNVEAAEEKHPIEPPPPEPDTELRSK